MDETKNITASEVQQAMMQLALYIIKEVCSGRRDLSLAETNFLININTQTSFVDFL